MVRCAPRNTSKAFATGDLTLTILSGSPVNVYGIWLSNPTAGALSFNIYEGDGTTLINTIDVYLTSTLELSTPWLADKGIVITAEAGDTFATVLHSNLGT